MLLWAFFRLYMTETLYILFLKSKDFEKFLFPVMFILHFGDKYGNIYMNILDVLFFILYNAMIVLTWLVVINVVSSWLFAFGILNPSNTIVSRVMDIIYKMTEPILMPVRNVIPSIGGLDLSPIIVLLALQGIKQIIVWLYLQIL